MNKWLVSLGVVLTFIVAPTVMAQVLSDIPQTEDDGAPAHVYVRNLTLDKKEYSVGEKVRGTFTLFNADDRIVSDVHYLVRLRGGYFPDGSATMLFDVKSHGPIFINALQERRVEFTYDLPSALAGKNLGIQIHAMLQSGFPLGWQDAQLSITGESRMVSVEAPHLTINDQSYDPGTGPTVARGQTVTADAILHNETDTPISVTPVVTIYNRSIASTPLETVRHDPVTINADGATPISLTLPTFNDTARVYAGVVELVDASNNTIGTPFTVRYIVEGDIANIERISTTQQSVKSGESITLVADLSASPIHFGGSGNNPVVVAVGKAMFKIQVLNERDQVVAETTQEINFDEPLPQRVFTLPAERDASQLKIRSSIVKNNRELASYQTDLEQRTPAEDEAPVGESRNTSTMLIVGIVAVILAFGAIAIAINQRHG